ncbi:hypothetical protein SY91_06928 (plasmid) [Burkholderia cenocepacia]|nr:hypothetical protein SY91_06928 [Burkholderia cenocepacia]
MGGGRYDQRLVVILACMASFSVSAASVCRLGPNSARPPWAPRIEAPFKAFHIGDPPHMKPTPFKLNDGLSPLRARTCIDGASKPIYLNVEAHGETGVIDVASGSCLDTFVPRAEISSGCEGAPNCSSIHWENWCYEDGKPSYIGFQGNLSNRGMYYVESASADDATVFVRGSGRFLIDRGRIERTFLLSSVKSQRLLVCSNFPRLVISVSSDPFGRHQSGQMTASSTCTAVEGNAVWVQSPVEGAHLQYSGTYQLLKSEK